MLIIVHCNFIKYTESNQKRIGAAEYIKLILDHYSQSVGASCKYKPGMYQEIPDNLFLHEKQDKKSSFPLYTGDTVRAASDWVFDEPKSKISFRKIRRGDVICVKLQALNVFFQKIHPVITVPYVLLTNDSDYAPDTKWNTMLDDPKILAWFVQNPNKESVYHAKLFTLPIGIANRSLPHGNLDEAMTIFSSVLDGPFFCYVNKTKIGWRKALHEKCSIYSRYKNIHRYHLYSNLRVNTNYSHRSKAVAAVERLKLRNPQLKIHNERINPILEWPTTEKSFKRYLMEVRMSRFVASPIGNGVDCFRTWESYLSGAVPIVQTSQLNSLYDAAGGFCLINDWDELEQIDIADPALYQSYKRNQTELGEYLMKADFWINLFRSFKNCQINK